MDDQKQQLDKVFNEYKLKSVFISGPFGVGKTTLVNDYIKEKNINEEKILRINFSEEFNEDSWYEYLFYKLIKRKTIYANVFKLIFVFIISALCISILSTMLTNINVSGLSNENIKNTLVNINNIFLKYYISIIVLGFILIVVFRCVFSSIQSIKPYFVKRFVSKSFKFYEDKIDKEIKKYEYIIIDDINRIIDKREKNEIMKLISYIFNKYIGQVDENKENNVHLIMIGDLDYTCEEIITKENLDKYIHWELDIKVNNSLVEKEYYKAIDGIVSKNINNLKNRKRKDSENDIEFKCYSVANQLKDKYYQDENEEITFRDMQKIIPKVEKIINDIIVEGNNWDYIFYTGKIDHGDKDPYVYNNQYLYPGIIYNSLNFKQFLYDDECYIPTIPLNKKGMYKLNEKCYIDEQNYKNYVIPFIILSNFDSNFSDIYFDCNQELTDSYMKDFLPQIIKMKNISGYPEINKFVAIAFYLNLEYKLYYNIMFEDSFTKYWMDKKLPFKEVFNYFEDLKDEIWQNENIRQIYEFIDFNEKSQRNSLFNENDRRLFNTSIILNFNNVLIYYIDCMDENYLNENKEDILKFLNNTYAVSYREGIVITDENYYGEITANKTYIERFKRIIKELNEENIFANYKLSTTENRNIFRDDNLLKIVNVERFNWEENNEK